MRRSYKGRTDSMTKSSEGEQGFWPSYADMMSAVALILFFLMLLSYIQNLITGNNLTNTEIRLESAQGALEDSRNRLASLEETLSQTQLQVEEATAELDRTNSDLEKVRLDLQAKEEDLANQEARLTAQTEQLNAQARQLEDQKMQLAEQDSLIAEQEDYMQAAAAELLEMRGRMQTIAVLRLSILEQIRDSVIRVMGDASKVSIGDNGNIILNEGVFFDVGSSALRADARPTLNQLTDVFEQFLSDDENARYVDSIMISGHTDSTGSDETNRQLSSARANAVLGYLLEQNGGRLYPYSSYFCAAGYGETRPVADNNTEAGRAQNRRIEISIILRDDSVMEIVENYLDLDLPATMENMEGATN